MTFDINQFLSEVKTNGYLRPWEYNVLISPPSALNGAQLTNQNQIATAGNMQSMISLRATQARTPAAQLEWLDVPRYGIGVKSGAPYNAQIKDCSFAIICDKYGNLYNYFHSWLNAIFTFSPLVNAQGGGIANQNRASYLVNYKDNYSTDIYINMYNQVGNVALQFVLLQAFPVTIKEIPLDWEQTKNLVELTIVVDYRDYSVSTSNLGEGQANSNLTSPTPVSNPSLSPLINTI